MLPTIAKKIKILGRTWKLKFVAHPEVGAENHSDCDNPIVPRPMIRVKLGLTGRQTLDAMIHEMLHAANWSLDENHVRQLATDMTRALLNPDLRSYWDR